MRPTVPEDVKPDIDQAKQLEDRGRYIEAVAIYRRALERRETELRPDLAVLHNNLGCALANLGEYDQASAEFLRAIELTAANRQEGIVTPDSYPTEPEGNLRAARARARGTADAPPARVETGSPFHPRPVGGFDPIRPGIGFTQYVFWFLLRSPVGWVLAATACIVIGLLRRDDSTRGMVIGVACISLLLVAFLAFLTDPRVRGGDRRR